ncbi:MAG: M3 family oligoendopeptidase [Patescibacteria group bacterium]
MTKIKTSWDLSLLYKNATDPQIEKDLRRAEAAQRRFVKKYRDRRDYLETEASLATALADYEKLPEDLLIKPLMYFHYRHDLDSRDSAIEAKINLLADRYTKSANEIAFFPIALSKIDLAVQKRFLASPLLSRYRYLLECSFAHGRHTLSEKEEQILNLMNQPAAALWVRGNEKVVSQQEIKWRGKTIPLTEAINQIHSLPTPARRALDRLVRDRLKSISSFAESELNAVVINKKIRDELRGYAEPYSATVLGYQNEPATVENLIATVTKHFPISHRFYRVKAKMLGLKSLSYADRSAKLGQLKKKIPFDQAVEIVRRAFGKVRPEYPKIFDQFLANGQIDVFPKTGKHGGAYCSSHDRLPTFILLNHLPDFASVTTLAHELGHAFHSTFSAKHQPPRYRGYSTATAEVASTLFENFVFDEIWPMLSAAERVIALHDRLNASIQTIFRQVACFNFELDLHRQIRSQGSLPKEAIARLMNQHMQSYLGPAFKLDEDDGYFFVYWSHLRSFFYVYSYAFGEIVSSALYAEYQADRKFEKKIRHFLSAGGSASPENIFAGVGLNLRQPNFFERGLKKIEAEIEKLERLI